jgi:hypothetical protein
MYEAHHVIWLGMTGRWPDRDEIEYVNGNTSDNRWDNLAEASDRTQDDVELNQAIVRELLDYYPETGVLIWRERDRRWFKSNRNWKMCNVKIAGKPAFTTVGNDGYKTGTIFGKSYSAHEIIFLWMTGRWPNPGMGINHDNRIRHDNRWVNLIEKSRQKSMQNKSLQTNNTSGHVGVCFDKEQESFRAYITANGHKYKRRFPTYEEAVAWREEKEREYCFHPNHGKPKLTELAI